MFADFTPAPEQIPTPVNTTQIVSMMRSDPNVLVTTGSLLRRFPEALAGVDMSLANLDDDLAFRVDRSSGEKIQFSKENWDTLRETLAYIFTRSPRTKVLANANEYRGRLPFFSLINSPEDDHVLAPATVRLLANDFRYVAENLEAWLAVERNLEDTPVVLSLFEEFSTNTRQCARRGGMIILG